jgi:hypothetical protein
MKRKQFLEMGYPLLRGGDEQCLTMRARTSA